MILKSESIGKIAAALVKAQKTMSNPLKESKNPFFKSSYANLNSVREAVMTPLNEAGISVLQFTSVNTNGKPVVLTTLTHESGEYVASETEIVVNKQNDPQAYGSGISYARRYGLQSLLCLGADDDDGEAAMGRTSEKPANKPPMPTKEMAQEKPAGQSASFPRRRPTLSEDLY